MSANDPKRTLPGEANTQPHSIMLRRAMGWFRLGQRARMQRRDFLAVLSLTVTWPFVVQAQQPKNVARIGFLATGSLESPETSASFDAFREGLRKLGYFEGENIVIEVRAADSKMERFPALVNEPIGLKVDIIVALNSLSGRAAKQATGTIPIVVPVMGDPVEDGLVASLARPGRECYGLNVPRSSAGSQALGLTQGGASIGFPGSGPLASARIWRPYDG
jgi:hypothetical protein